MVMPIQQRVKKFRLLLIEPSEEYTFSRFLAVSTSPLAAVGVILERKVDGCLMDH